MIPHCVLAGGSKSGFSFSWAAGTSDGAGNYQSYGIYASITVGTTGQRHFYTDQSGVIRANATGAANINSTPLS